MYFASIHWIKKKILVYNENIFSDNHQKKYQKKIMLI